MSMKGSQFLAVTVSIVETSFVKNGEIVEEGLNGIVLEDNVDVSVDRKVVCAFENAIRKKCTFFIAMRSQTMHFCQCHLQIMLYESINNNFLRILFYWLR